MSAVLALAMPCAWAAPAAAWPLRPVRIVVPAPAGSSLDVVARTLVEGLLPAWKQPVVVDNKPGAGGLIGVDAAAKAAPDGQVLALAFNGPLAYAPFLYASMPYDPARDLVPVVMTSSQPNVLAVGAAVPAATVRELIAWARGRGGDLAYASVGAGSSSHLAMELLKRQAGFEAMHVPYNGSPAAAWSVARGETQLLFAVASGVLPLVQSGQVRLLATTGARRFDGLPDLPTLAESGLPAYVAEAWNGLVVAAGTPPGRVRRINTDVNRVLDSPAVRARFHAVGMAVAGGTPQSFAAAIAAERKRWAPVIRDAGIRLE